MTDCLAETGAPTAWIVAGLLALVAVAIGVAFIARTRAGRASLLGLALVGLLALGTGALTPPAASAADCTAAAPDSTAPTPTPTPSTAPVGVEGDWSGRTGRDDGYLINVTLSDDGTTASGAVDYPEFPCTATWTQTARTATTITFVEKLGENPENCADDGTVTLTLVGDPLTRLDFTYTYLGETDPIDYAELTRVP